MQVRIHIGSRAKPREWHVSEFDAEESRKVDPLAVAENHGLAPFSDGTVRGGGPQHVQPAGGLTPMPRRKS